MAGGDWSAQVPALEKMLADLKTLHASLHGDMSHEEYCVQVGVGNHGRRIIRFEAA